jgi:hypothetical protein
VVCGMDWTDTLLDQITYHGDDGETLMGRQLGRP